MAIHDLYRDHDSGYGVDYNETDIDRLSAPDCTREEVGKVIRNVRVADDPSHAVDDVAERLFNSSWRYDRCVVEYLLDCGLHTTALLCGANPEQARHILEFCFSQMPYNWEDAIDALASEDGPALDKEFLAELLQSPSSGVREAAMRAVGRMVPAPKRKRA